jgi:2-deoxy-D-gluconate 3-dehydrogenase
VDFCEDHWDAMIETRLMTVCFLSQVAARHLVQRGPGENINIASLLTFHGSIRVPSNAAAKSGAGGLTKATANELVPGYIGTSNAVAL